MNIVLTNKLDPVTLVPTGFTITLTASPGRYQRGQYLSISADSGITDGGGGNFRSSSSIITDNPEDSFLFVGNMKIITGVIIFKLFVLKNGSYTCYLVVQDYRKRNILLQQQVDAFQARKTANRNPIVGQSPVTIPGVLAGAPFDIATASQDGG